MKRFKTTVTRTDEYIIEIDENIIDEQWMQHFRQYFADYKTYEEHAEYLTQHRARFEQSFIEGYGEVKINGSLPWHLKDGQKINGDDNGINIIVKSEDQDCEVEVEEIE